MEGRIRAVHDAARKYRVPPEELPQLLAGWGARLIELETLQDAAALAEREAQAFRPGEGLATPSWCAVRGPGAPGRAGLLVLASTGGRGDAEPTCEASLRHEAIAPLVASFALE